MPQPPLTPNAPALLADVGGTNARFALLDAAHALPRAIRTLPCADYPGIDAAIAAYLADSGAQPQRAVVAIANPITGDAVRMTNHHWSFSIEAVRQRLGLQQLKVINDFTALALALPRLAAADCLQIGGGVAAARGPKALLGPGTGLGVSGLLPSGSDGWIALAGEGGHVSFSPADELELEILRLSWRRHAHVSAERLLSGGLGLPLLYQALCEIAGVAAEPLDSAEISRRALNASCPQCRQTLERFCTMLGTAAANLALTLGASGGVYLGGGILPRFPGFFAASGFRARFEDKGRFSDYLKAIPCYLITADNPALLGAAAALAD